MEESGNFLAHRTQLRSQRGPSLRSRGLKCSSTWFSCLVPCASLHASASSLQSGFSRKHNSGNLQIHILITSHFSTRKKRTPLVVGSGAYFHGVKATTLPSFKSPPPWCHLWSAGKRCCPEPGWAGGSPFQSPPTQPYCTSLSVHTYRNPARSGPCFQGIFQRRQRRKEIITEQCGNWCNIGTYKTQRWPQARVSPLPRLERDPQRKLPRRDALWLRVYHFSSVQLLSPVWLFATPWTAAHQASLSIINSQSWLRLITISSSVIPFSFCLQSFPASGSFPMSKFFASGDQSIGT